MHSYAAFSEKTKFSSDWPIKSLTTMRQASNAPEYNNGQLVGTVGVTERTMGKQADGSPIAINYTVKYSGAEYFVTGTGAPFGAIAIKQINANTFFVTMSSASTRYSTSGQIVVSKDGKTMITSLSGTNAQGKPTNARLVYERQ